MNSAAASQPAPAKKLDSADITTTVATSVASERAKEVASAAVSETVSAMLDSATTMAVAAVERPVQQVLAPATTSTPSGDETAVVPPPLSDAPELSTDRVMSSIELSGRDREDEESFESQEEGALKPPAEALLSSIPQQLRNDSDTPVQAPNRSRTSRGDDDDAVVIPVVDRPINNDVNKCDDTEGAQPEKYESEGMRDKQGGGAREEDTQGVGDGKVQDDSTERHGGRDNKVDNTEEIGSSEDGDGRTLHHSGPEDGATVLVSGTRKGAVVQVVERLHPSYQLIVSVSVAASALSSAERNGKLDGSESNHHPSKRTETSEEGDNPANECGKATVTASLSLGKSEIKGALERLEIVPVAVEGGKPSAANEDEQLDDDGESGKRWALKISNREVNTSEKDNGADDGEDNNHDGAKGVPVRSTARRGSSRSGGGDKRGWGQQYGGQADAKEGQGEDSSPSNAAVRAVVDGTAAPPIAAWESAGMGGGGGNEEPLWHWWDDADPWSRGPRSYVTAASTSTDRGPSRSGSGPPPPAYQEMTPPPPYSETVKRYAATQRSSPTPKTGPEGDHQRTPSFREAATRHVPSGSVISSGDASSFSSDGDASLGPPPSYHSTAAGGGTARSSSPSAAGEEDEKSRFARDLPPPSYGRFYDTLSGTAAGLSHPETNGRGEDAGGIDEWWARDEDQHFDQNSPDTQPEKQRTRHRRHRSSDGGGGGSSRLWASGGGAIERSGTNHGDQRSLRGGAGASRGRRPPHEGRGGWKRSPTASGGRRPKTTMGVSRGKSRHGTKDGTSGLSLSGTESWNDDRWRLTRYLQACQKELTEAEEGRRRAEAAANAAERRAWKTADSVPYASHDTASPQEQSRGGGDDDAEKRAWARAATQRVLDLMLVTERVRQEEQKRRVAEARANNQFIVHFSALRLLQSWVSPRADNERRVDGLCYKHVVDGAALKHVSAVAAFSALGRARRVAAACLEEGTDFAQPFRDMDADGGGRLTLAEMGAALKRVGAHLSLSQVTALFRHFRRGRLGLDKVDRGEILWEFIDTKRLLEQWRSAGDIGGGHRARTAPFRKRANRASYSGGDDGRGGGASGGTLSRYDFSRALEELGVHVDGWEAGALMDRFGLEKDELFGDDANPEDNEVDWRTFVSFMQTVEREEDGKDDDDKNKRNHYGGRNKTAVRSGKEGRAGLRTTLPRGGKDEHRFPRQQQRWATSGLHRGGGLFERGQGDATWSHSIPPAEKATSSPKASATAGAKPYTYWASSAPISGGRYNTPSSADKQAPLATTTSATARGAPPLEMASAQSPSGFGKEEGWKRWRKGGRENGGRPVMANAAEASKVLDELLEDERELEAFLEEEFARRERAAIGAEDFSRGQEQRRWGSRTTSKTCSSCDLSPGATARRKSVAEQTASTIDPTKGAATALPPQTLPPHLRRGSLTLLERGSWKSPPLCSPPDIHPTNVLKKNFFGTAGTGTETPPVEMRPSWRPRRNFSSRYRSGFPPECEKLDIIPNDSRVRSSCDLSFRAMTRPKPIAKPTAMTIDYTKDAAVTATATATTAVDTVITSSEGFVKAGRAGIIWVTEGYS
ncbi:hypothetical protein Esi_0037_0136 [Ectocarpus siliculosus]|uniref:EF-hand domain-containing protein n=1 Tax=Ectocarpus siliculosus TaxID=2880 RepID=D8LLS0_ECTSI|nr:hypothetical protein Esi_0037_0136 [Ectocarpus siliculosus]|eukprot:CBN74701.1 hypothetical protein Esi_0037_0136 [Ectocarpus siliculosus]